MNTLPFCNVELAGRIERVEAQMITTATEAARRRLRAATFVIPVAGGAACYAEDGSPLNKMVGLGLAVCPAATLWMRSSRRSQRAGPPRRSNYRTLRIPPSAQP